MRYSKILEAPQLVPPTDFDLSNREINLARAADFTRHPAETFRDFPRATLFVQAGNVGGQIGLLSKITGLLEYYVHYDIATITPFGRCATQVKLWRSDTATVQNTARMGFQEILLRRFDTLISDRQQTDRGMEFWKGQISALADAKTVGIIDARGVHVFDHVLPISDWIYQQDGWNKARSYRRKRFFISNLAADQLD
jgi:hypothetical protein